MWQKYTQIICHRRDKISKEYTAREEEDEEEKTHFVNRFEGQRFCKFHKLLLVSILCDFTSFASMEYRWIDLLFVQSIKLIIIKSHEQWSYAMHSSFKVSQQQHLTQPDVISSGYWSQISQIEKTSTEADVSRFQVDTCGQIWSWNQFISARDAFVQPRSISLRNNQTLYFCN